MTKPLILGMVVLTALIGLMSPLAADVNSSSDLSSVGVQTRETSLGDLVTDAVTAGAGISLALIPAGSFREITIPKGTVKPDDIVKGLQYPDDKISVIELTGNQITQALERSVSIYSQKNLGFLQVSGISFTFNPGSPKGSRVTSITIDGAKIAGDRKYRVATTEPLADGAYGYFTIWGKNLKPSPTNKTTERAVTDYLSKHNSIDYVRLDRIMVKGK